MALNRFLSSIKAIGITGHHCFKSMQPSNNFSRCFQANNFHTSASANSLLEFFEDKKFWNVEKIQVGRAWKKEELRLKSNSDLHKLWFVLLKERNLLMTMEHYYNENYIAFPNPERIDKIKISMENLEDVVRERNRAYHELETGESGERPGELVYNQLGMRFFYRKFEHAIPKNLNTKWNRHHKHYYNDKEVKVFHQLMREKAWNEKRRKKNRERQEIIGILKRWPDTDLEALKEKYSVTDEEVKKMKEHPDAQPHKLVSRSS